MNKLDSLCLQKAHHTEPIFVLRAQDKIAPAVVRVWAHMVEQLTYLQQHAEPPTVDAALARLEERLVEVFVPFNAASVRKAADALLIANAMEQWPNRKLPD